MAGTVVRVLTATLRTGPCPPKRRPELSKTAEARVRSLARPVGFFHLILGYWLLDIGYCRPPAGCLEALLPTRSRPPSRCPEFKLA